VIKKLVDIVSAEMEKAWAVYEITCRYSRSEINPIVLHDSEEEAVSLKVPIEIGEIKELDEDCMHTASRKHKRGS